MQAEERHTEILGRLLYAAKIVAEKEGILDGFRVVINNGPQACKSILFLCHLKGKQNKNQFSNLNNYYAHMHLAPHSLSTQIGKELFPCAPMMRMVSKRALFI